MAMQILMHVILVRGKDVVIVLPSHTLSWVKEPFGSLGIADARND